MCTNLVNLQRTNLSVSKDCGIVALEAAIDEALCAVGVDGFLLAVHIEDVVISEGFVLTKEHLWLPGHYVRTDVTALNLLFGQLRTNPNRHTKR